MDTAPGGFKNIVRNESITRQEIATGEWPISQVEVWTLMITRLELAFGKIVEQSRPSVFSITANDGIGVRNGIVRNQRHMRAAEDDGNFPRAKMIRQLVRPASRSSNNREAD
jgi:hypothetical protein